MIMRKIIGILIGAGIGFGIGYFSRCIGAKGWSLTSNPWSGMLIGAIIGYLLISKWYTPHCHNLGLGILALTYLFILVK